MKKKIIKNIQNLKNQQIISIYDEVLLMAKLQCEYFHFELKKKLN